MAQPSLGTNDVMTITPKHPIFLSASVPDRDLSIYRADPVAVREAVRALVAIAVPDRVLVFGGHPAITPLVWDGADSLSASEFVYVYQSELYRPLIPPRVRFFPNVVWTPIRPAASLNNPRDREDSLRTMRHWMIEQRRLDLNRAPLDEYHAGVFIGGMDGVEKEWAMFVQAYPTAPALPVASTEGAARRLWSNPASQPLVPQPTWASLASDLNYRRLFRSLLS